MKGAHIIVSALFERCLPL